jgi:hypothetical protein
LIDWGDDEEEKDERDMLPMRREKFLELNRSKLLNFEIDELKNLN